MLVAQLDVGRVGSHHSFLDFARRPDLIEAMNLVGVKRRYDVIAVLGSEEDNSWLGLDQRENSRP